MKGSRVKETKRERERGYLWNVVKRTEGFGSLDWGNFFQ